MSTASEPLHCFLYHSQLAPNAPLTCIAEIVRAARQFNKQAHITGLLLFDGQRFCQYIEGPSVALQQLIERIEADPRHNAFTPIFLGHVAEERRFSRWAMAYVLLDDEEPMNELQALKGPSALEKLHALLPLLDAV